MYEDNIKVCRLPNVIVRIGHCVVDSHLSVWKLCNRDCIYLDGTYTGSADDR